MSLGKYGLSASPYGHGIDFLIGEEGVRRTQFFDDPISVRDLLKCEDAVRL